MVRSGYCFCILLLLTIFVTSSLSCLSNSQNSSSKSIRNCANKTTSEHSNKACNDSLGRCNDKKIAAPTIRTVEDFCIFMKISQTNCSCEKLAVICKVERWLRYDRLVEDYHLAVSIEVTIAMVLGVVGNSAVLLSSFHRRHQLSTNKIVIALLALTDGISSVLNFIQTSPQIWTNEEWAFGVPFCKITHTGMMACSWLSSGFILLIGVERYCGILHPLRRSLYSKKTVLGCVVANVIVVLCAGSPMLAYTTIDKERRCHVTAGGNIMVPYRWVLMVLFMVLPMSAVVFIYLRIIFHLYSLLHDNASIHGRVDIRLKRAKENRRAMMILLPIVAAFTICVLPVSVIDLYFAYFNVDGVLFIDPLIYLDLWLVYNLCYPLHACINPIIYTSVDPEFRKNLRSVFRFRQRYDSRHSRDSQTAEKMISSDSF